MLVVWTASGSSDEKNLSAEQYSTKANPWFPYPYGDAGRPQGLEATPGEGAKEIDGIGSTQAGTPIRAG
jgi:hypothetical protein